MKFIAMLRDSLRETLDVKLFYVLVGLSVCTVVLAGSVTYKPVEVDRQLNVFTGFFNQMIKTRLGPAGKDLDFRIDIDNFERLDSRQEPWLGDYQFDYVVRLSVQTPEGKPIDPEQRKVLTQLRDELKQSLSAEELKRQMGQMFREVEVRPLKSDPDLPANTEEIRFQVKTKGTRIKSRQEWFHEPALFFGAVPIPITILKMSGIIEFIANYLIGGFGAAFTLLLSVIMTASFLPSMLAKGTVDLLIVKPVYRVSLFLYKYVGGLLFMFLNTAVIMAGLWLVIGLQTGTWLSALLVCIFVYTFQFAILYAVSALMAVLTRSPIVCILSGVVTWGVLIAIGWLHWGFIERRRDTVGPEVRQHWAFVGFDTLYTVTPRFKELDWLTNKLIESELIQIRPEAPPSADDRAAVQEYEQRQEAARKTHAKQVQDLEKRYGLYNWTSSLTVSSLFIAFVLGLACWRFAVKDY